MNDRCNAATHLGTRCKRGGDREHKTLFGTFCICAMHHRVYLRRGYVPIHQTSLSLEELAAGLEEVAA